MKPIYFLVFLLMVFIAAVDARTKAAAAKKGGFRGGKIYELNSEKKNLLFTMNANLKTESKGVTVFASSYLDQDKNEMMTEEAFFDRLQLQKYLISQKQLNENYSLEITGGKMVFSVTKNGQIEKKTRNLPSNLIIGPSFVPFMQQHWSEIQNHKKIKAELAVLEMMDTFSFVFEKIRDEKSGDDDAVVVRMKPKSSLVSSVVRPAYFLVKADGSRIIELKGRMLPKRKVGSHWEDIEGEAVFTY